MILGIYYINRIFKQKHFLEHELVINVFKINIKNYYY